MKTVVLLIAAILAVSLSVLAGEVLDSPWVQVTIVSLLTAGIMALAIRYRGERRLPLLCDPMVLVCVFLAQFFVIGPMSLPLFHWHLQIHLPIELVLRTMVAFVVLLLSFIVAYQIRLGTIIAGHLPDFSGGRLKLPGRLAEALMLAGSVLGIAMYFDARGGVAVVLGTGYGQGGYYSGFYQIPFHTLILGTIMMAWRIADDPKTTRMDRIAFGVLLLCEVPFFAVVIGARNRLFFLFFGLYAVWAIRRGISRMWKVATVPILALLLAFFALWGTIRARPLGEIVQGGSTTQYAQEAWYMGYFSSVAEPFAVACMIFDLFPNSQPFRHGKTLLVTLFAFIPRSVWPDKPVGFGKEVTRFTDGVFYKQNYGHSFTVTFLGDFWANAGWLGVIVGGLVFGVIARTVASYATAGMVQGGVQTSPSRVLLAAVFVASLAEVRSESATILAFWCLMIPWLVLALLFFRLDYSRRAVAGALEPPPP